MPPVESIPDEWMADVMVHSCPAPRKSLVSELSVDAPLAVCDDAPLAVCDDAPLAVCDDARC